MIFGLSLAIIVDRLVTFYTYLILAYVVLSWFPIREGLLFDIYRVLGTICEPYIGIFRRILPKAAVGGAGIDFSPFVAVLVLQILRGIIVSLLRTAGF